MPLETETTETTPPAPENETTTTDAKGETPKAPEDVSGLKSALDAERKARREAEARAKALEPYEKQLKEAEEAGKSELTKATEALATERDARTKAETALLRFQVGADKGVPVKLVQFLSGSTKEEIEASADTLLAEIGNGDRPATPGRPTERVVSNKPSSTLDNDDPMALIRKARRLDDNT